MKNPLSKSDIDFSYKAMCFFGISRVRFTWSDSRAKYPDIWVEMFPNKVPIITVTQEWKRQSPAEREKRIVHEMLHIKGYHHGKHDGLDYNTRPNLDTYSAFIRTEVLNWWDKIGHRIPYKPHVTKV